jgi:cytochrome c-type biogenesis protein CcmH/NrfG
MVTVLAILLVLGTVAYLGYPLWRRDRSYAPVSDEGVRPLHELRAEKDALLRALKELEFDLASGKLSVEDHEALRSRYETRAMAVLRELDTLEAEPISPSPAVPMSQPTVTSPVKAAAAIWSRPVFVGSVVGFLLLIIGGGGFLLGRVTQRGPQEVAARNAVPGEEETLISRLENRLTQNPKDLEALVGLGRIYLQTGQMPKAIEVYKRALEVDRDNVSALSGMAMILAQAGHSDQALSLFDRALAINPQMPMALLFKGRILYEEKRDFSGAIAHWEQFLRVAPQGGPADVVRGWIEEARREAHKMEGERPAN